MRSKYTPPPPRIAVLPLLNGSHANPKRGATLIGGSEYSPAGAPFFPPINNPSAGSPKPGANVPTKPFGNVWPLIGFRATFTPFTFAGRSSTGAVAGLYACGENEES